MKHFNKKFLLITIFLCIFMLSGCGKNDEKYDYNTNGNSTETSQSNTSKDTDNDTDNESVDQQSNKNSMPAPSSVKPVANKKLMIYTIKEEEIEPATAMIPEKEKITASLVVNTVVEALEDQSIIVGIDEVTSKDDIVIVSFKQNKAPLKNVGAKYETAILNAIAQSLIDNIKGCHKVIYRVEGKAYKSSHISLGMNDVYLGDK